ncbi:MAG TPA: class II aldolase/adducin family protein [Candidatus Hydrogenedentes bacterium]|nr:class II aldolase/adducin family protein [Candidatus Hydrogenedentota bacterium]
MDLFEKFAGQIETFVGVCHTLSRNMYVTGHGGNLAWKMDDDTLLITPTQMNKGDIRREDATFLNFNGEVVAGKRRPTGETPMYINFFRERPDIRSVIHCHPPYVNAFAITTGPNWLMRPFFPETITEVGPVPIVPYGEPLTQRLADNFLPFLKKYNAFLMENHGLVIMSRLDIQWTLMNTELLEMTAKHILHALPNGGLKEIAREDVRNMDNIMRTRNLPYMGAPDVWTSLEQLYFEEA